MIWGLVVSVFGMTQTQILPGDFHWIVQVSHLAVGLVALVVAEWLARAAQVRLVAAHPLPVYQSLSFEEEAC
jgi:hypothetical protein